MAAATGAGLFSAVLSPAAGRFKFKRKVPVSATVTPTQPPAFTVSDNGRLHEAATVDKRSDSSEAMPEDQRLSLKDYFELSKDMIRSDGGPPRWFSPFECGSRLNGSPLLLFLPGIDGVGLGLILQHQRLGEIFDIWCLHIPVMDRTPFADLVELVERTVRSENCNSPKKTPLQLSLAEEFRISFHSVDKPSTTGVRTEYLSVFSHSHYLLPKVFPTFKRVVVLDDDIVVQRDLLVLWSLDMEGKVNGAVQFCAVQSLSLH
ncbi:hypothetical protein CsSME_00007616 [Camellia sinensis var. sinensis]